MSHLTTHLTKRQSWFTLFVTVFLAFVLWLSFPVSGTVRSMGGAGTGPGGVGATDGSGTLEVWYQSDKTVYSDTACTTPQTTDNGTVACWPDHSGNDPSGYGFEAKSSVAGEQPTLQTNTWNGHPVISWDGDDILVTTENVTLGPLTVFVVYNASELGYLYVHSPNVNTNDGSYIYTEVTASYSVKRGGLEDYEDVGSSWGINATPRIITQQYNGSPAAHLFYINGLLQTPIFTQTNNVGTAAVSTVFSIGERRDNRFVPLTGITGNFAEVIAYNEYLNVAQRILVENYLQAKFNDSTVDNITISSDRYDGDTTTNGNFDLDVAGIGRATSTETHTEAHSVGIIVENGSFLQDNGDYVLFGHRNITNTNTTENLPMGWGGDARRWTRHWYFDVTDVGINAGGTVTITFDFSEGDMNGGSNPQMPVSNYHLLGRSGFGPTDDFTAVFTATAIYSDRVVFGGVPVTVLGSNFTLGSLDAAASPTTIIMQSAAATLPTPPWFIIALVLLALGVSAVIMVARGRKA